MTVLLTNQNSKTKKVLKKTLIIVSIISILVCITGLIFFIKGICDKIKFERIYDRINYLSSCVILFKISEHNAGCLRNESESFYDASTYCYSNDMLLLEIDSEEELEIVLKETVNFFENFDNSSRIWINGKWSNYEKKWLSYPKNIKLAFKLGDSLKDYNDGDKNCLSIESSKNSKTYNFASVSCDDLNFYYCEF
ncbi:hypothetical protein PVAND_009680 [Polypedilum vanderplanki]|uniref:C-type lectin domain-containing protein n=1 Tax=Polypedilum vanderplanki TaxID=319348 RepID=A0A9J6CEE8_POLVA|nr:hypothetical protein PVAND_009680 [Polypedilum vanderplanki]